MSSLRSIVAFDDPLPEGVAPASLLGGKGAGLVEMSQALGLPVPPGFVITTEVCRTYRESGWPAGLNDDLARHLDRLGAQLGRGFGNSESPLLVSVRSGAPVSMPGMMDTLLNVGMTPTIRERLAKESGSPHFAADAWLRFCRMYAEIVVGLDKRKIAEAGSGHGSAEELLATAERVREFASVEGTGIPGDPGEQLRGP